MKSIKLLFLVALPMGYFSCQGDSEELEVLNVSSDYQTLFVQNLSNQNLYYFVADQDILAALYWVPSVEGEPPLRSKSNISLLLSEITGYTAESEVLIMYYWEAVTVGDQTVPGKIDFVAFRVNDPLSNNVQF